MIGTSTIVGQFCIFVFWQCAKLSSLPHVWHVFSLSSSLKLVKSSDYDTVYFSVSCYFSCLGPIILFHHFLRTFSACLALEVITEPAYKGLFWLVKIRLTRVQIFSKFGHIVTSYSYIHFGFSESVFSCTSVPDINIILCWICIHDDETVFRCNPNIQFYLIIHPAYQAAFPESHLPEWSGKSWSIRFMVLNTEMWHRQKIFVFWLKLMKLLY